MKTKHLFLTSGMAALTFAVPSWAGDAVTGSTDLPRKGHSEWAKQASQTRRAPLGPITRSADLIGREVVDAKGEKLGKVEDLAVDTASGRIAQVIVSSGGFLGIGDRMTAVPPGAFAKTADGKPLRLDVEKSRFKDAPRFNMERWDESVDQNRVAEVYRYYSVEPYFVVVKSTETFSDHPQTHLGHLIRAKELVGMNVKNTAGDTIGEVKDLLVDLHNGRVNQALVSTGGFLGVGDEVSVVPPEKFEFSNQDKYLVLDVSKETLLNAPRYKPANWYDSQESTFIGKVYQAFGVEPYFDPAAPITWNSADIADASGKAKEKTAQDQGDSERDLEITRDIRRAIIAKDGFSMNAQNIKIITDEGEVTLKGQVNSQWEKKTIEDLAATVVDRSKIDNQLQVTASVAVH